MDRMMVLCSDAALLSWRVSSKCVVQRVLIRLIRIKLTIDALVRLARGVLRVPFQRKRARNWDGGLPSGTLYIHKYPPS